MRGHNELRVARSHPGHVQHQCQLTLGRQGGFRLVHDIEAGAAECLEEIEETLPVGLLMEVSVAIGWTAPLRIVFRGFAGEVAPTINSFVLCVCGSVSVFLHSFALFFRFRK